MRHLLLLALAHAVHYLGCRRLAELPPVPSAFVAFACVYNMRTLDEFRYGTALEAAVYGHALVIVAAAGTTGRASNRWLCSSVKPELGKK